MSLQDVSGLNKIMLVSHETCDEVEKCLLAAGRWVVKVKSGEAAVAKAQREIFDAAVLVSTGKEMDLAETVFNLRDINGSMQIIIVTDRGGMNQNALASQIAQHFGPNTIVLTLEELENLVELPKRGKKGIGG